MQKSIKLFMAFLFLFPLTVLGQTDTTYLFRFVPAKDMFFVPYGENATQLQRLLEITGRHREKILSGEIPVLVDGYCNSTGNREQDLAISRLRANRVKSELIVKGELKEECFLTHNHAGRYEGTNDVVVVRLRMPKVLPAEKEAQRAEAESTDERVSSGEPATPVMETGATPVEKETAVKEPVSTPSDFQSAFSLRFNLLRWATLTPDLGIEWRINRHVGILVNGSWTSWSWSDKDRRYALWEVNPEVRYYVGKEKRGYVGAMYKVGQFNYKFSDTGKQGDLMGGGLVGGYQLKLNGALLLDLSLGVGCVHADYEKYTVIDGVRVKHGKESKNWWGPTQAGVTLVWTIF